MGLRINKMVGWGTQEFHATSMNLKRYYDQDGTTTEFMEWVRKEVVPDQGKAVLGRELDESDLFLTKLLSEEPSKDGESNPWIQWGSGIDKDAVWNSIAVSEDERTIVATEFNNLRERFRRDHSIDYYEGVARAIERGDEPEMEDKFLPLDISIDPHNFYVLNDGRVENFQDSIMRRDLIAILNLKSDGLDLKDKQVKSVQKALDSIGKKYGFDGYDEYRAELHPQIPLEVELVLLWTDIYSSSVEIHRDLRPCVFQWWK